jgi:aarF domain-containing kinase
MSVGECGAGPSGAREALKLLLSPEGKFFREFITNEVVLSIDAMSRTQLVALLHRLGLSGVRVPLLLPGAPRSW